MRWLSIGCVLLLVACDGRGGIDASSGRDGAAAMDAGADADALLLDGAPGDGGWIDAGAGIDAAVWDAGLDAAVLDATVLDASARDAGGLDAGRLDAGGLDAGGLDAGRDAGADAGRDGGADAGRDAGADAGARGSCISGATGTHAVRFRWAGSGPSSTAYVVYEENELPDTSRWHVSANSRSFGYTPVFTDTFLGEGGLDLEGTAFIDVELSTVGLSSIRNVTLAIYGRSFATTTSGSFEWQTFDGTGASPYGGVANSAPYEWYTADATAEIAAGDGGILLRITAGPPSDALIVNRVELCFDAR